ncbi:DUF4190 domain-containing protein [Demequina litorisediminis]|uniref:DUF4190 domain-containing protein n=1 Tax=Demequina litorisediminis TaxID=1849022 RepID=A0ABQ6IHI0_9MICO|nr:DUF4190 domain-containing protein [Demequina litorisediminis]GMA36861.1 hypothetical protein GCM10025876_30650 [Demequina litorisediminis]
MTEQPQQDPQQPSQPQYAVPPQGSTPYGTPHYGAPQYSQPGYPVGPRPGTEKNWMNITSLALSLGGFVTGVTFIPGIVFGHLGLSAAKRGEADNRGLGLAGLIIGYVMLALIVIGLVVATVLFATLVTGVVEDCGGSSPAEWCSDSTAVNAWAAVTGGGL